MTGAGARRHFTYRAKQFLVTAGIGNNNSQKSTPHRTQNRRPLHTQPIYDSKTSNCQSYSNVVAHSNHQYAVPVANKFNPLNY